MQAFAQPRVTPWVLRLTIANAVVLLLMETVFTSDGLLRAVAFTPGSALTRPWTFVTYMFVHRDLVHLLLNSLGLLILGAPVEQRLGPSRFLSFYLFCGVGAALFSLVLSVFVPILPFIGASGAVLGLAIGFAMLWPDAEMLLFPIPIPMRARTFALLLVGFNALMALPFLRGGSSIAYEAHLGGALFGWIWFRLRGAAEIASLPPRRPVERAVMVPPADEAERDSRPAAAPLPRRRRPEADPVAVEMDRVLDKISAQGIQSLTPEERRFLDEVAERKRKERG